MGEINLVDAQARQIANKPYSISKINIADDSRSMLRDGNHVLTNDSTVCEKIRNACYDDIHPNRD